MESDLLLSFPPPHLYVLDYFPFKRSRKAPRGHVVDHVLTLRSLLGQQPSVTFCARRGAPEWRSSGPSGSHHSLFLSEASVILFRQGLDKQPFLIFHPSLASSRRLPVWDSWNPCMTQSPQSPMGPVSLQFGLKRFKAMFFHLLGFLMVRALFLEMQ